MRARREYDQAFALTADERSILEFIQVGYGL